MLTEIMIKRFIHIISSPICSIGEISNDLIKPLKENIISILSKKHSMEITKLMNTCNLPCKRLSCNVFEPHSYHEQ